MKLKETFQSPYESCGITEMCSDFNGKPFAIVREITEADATHDQEVLPMYVISINGKEIEAWPEEIYVDD